MNTTRTCVLADRRILIVEDSWHIAFAIETVLKAQGAQVLGPAPSLADADRFTGAAMDLALVDVNLNGEMSYALIERLLERGVKVVVMSGYDIDPALRARVVAVIEKPFDPGALVTVLAKLLP